MGTASPGQSQATLERIEACAWEVLERELDCNHTDRR